MIVDHGLKRGFFKELHTRVGNDYETWPRGNSVEHEFFLLVNVKMPKIVGTLTFMSRKNSILGLSGPEKC